MMKICLVNYTDIGIHEPRGRKIAKTLAEKGHEVLWICGEEKGKETLSGVKVVYLKPPQFLPFRLKELRFISLAAKHFKNINKDFNTDIILGYSHVGAIAARKISKSTKIPYVIDYPDPFYTGDAIYKSSFFKRVVTAIAAKSERKAMRSSAAVVTISNKLVQEATDNYGLVGKEIIVVPNAPDLEKFSPARSKIKSKTITIVYSGKAIPEYGVECLLAGFAKAYETNKNLKLLLIVKLNTEEKVWLAGKVKQFFISGGLEILENVKYDDMPEKLRSAQVAVYPYPRSQIHDYAVPNKLLEYLATGLPVIATKMPATEELLQNNAGLLFEDKNSQALADILLLLAKKPAMLRSMGTSARKLAIEKYDWNKHINVYEKLLMEKSK